MSRFRLPPAPAQEAALAEHCAHARHAWNLAVEQHAHWKPGRKSAPGFAEQCRQLTEARAASPWLAAGSSIVQQQALKDFAQAITNFFGGTHRRPTWRKRGQAEGFRIVAVKAGDVRRLSRNTGEVKIPKVGWVRFRWSRPVPDGAKSYRVTRDRAGHWHVAFAAVPPPIPAPGTGEAVGVDRGVAVSAALSTGELLNVPRPARHRKNTPQAAAAQAGRTARGTIEAPGRNVRQKAGLNRGILAAGWGRLVRRLEHKAPSRVRKIDPRHTSQTCNACKHVAGKSRESQALFLCVACGHRDNADVNAAKNMRDTAAGHAVTAPEGPPLGGPVNREPQPDLPQRRSNGWDPPPSGGGGCQAGRPET
ncbi:transposase [Nonomuraea wenchangensis]